MILFVDIEGVLVQQCFRRADTTFRHIILNERNFAWIKSQNFERIFIVTNQKGIGEGWLDEKLFDFQIGYVARALKLYTNTKVDVRYYPYEKPNGFLIKDILKEFNIEKDNAVILGNKKNHKKDAAFSGLKYIDAKELKIKIDIEILHKGKIIQNKKILTDEEINNCVCGVGSVLHRTLSEMENDVIKNFLNEFTEYGKQSEAEAKE